MTAGSTGHQKERCTGITFSAAARGYINPATVSVVSNFKQMA